MTNFLNTLQSYWGKANSIISLLLYYLILKHLPDGYDHKMFNPFNKMRSHACRNLFASMGENVNIHQGVKFGLGNKIYVGNNSHLGVNLYINGRGGVTLGDHVLMGPDIIIYTGTHTYSRYDIPIQQQPMRYDEVVVEDDVWLGARVIILPGVCIGRGSIVGANSVVTKDVAPNSIVAGSPARLIRKREEKP